LSSFADDLIDHDEKKEFVDAKVKYDKHVAALKALTLKAKPKAKAGARAPKKRKCCEKDLIMVEIAKKYLPTSPFTTITTESEWHTRFRVTYPTAVLLNSTSCCYDDKCEKSKREAMLFCLRWAWKEHTFLTEEVCPWELE
jgi:hypothetical protein